MTVGGADKKIIKSIFADRTKLKISRHDTHDSSRAVVFKCLFERGCAEEEVVQLGGVKVPEEYFGLLLLQDGRGVVELDAKVVADEHLLFDGLG